jgi:hypothetical protein
VVNGIVVNGIMAISSVDSCAAARVGRELLYLYGRRKRSPGVFLARSLDAAVAHRAPTRWSISAAKSLYADAGTVVVQDGASMYGASEQKGSGVQEFAWYGGRGG